MPWHLHFGLRKWHLGVQVVTFQLRVLQKQSWELPRCAVGCSCMG
jgi:hypothetical protein